MEAGGKTTPARRHHLFSALLDAQTFARAVRAHWGVENRLHWVLEVIVHDDLARPRSGHGPENMAVVKHMALNLLNTTAKTDSLNTRRKRAGWDDDYLQAVINPNRMTAFKRFPWQIHQPLGFRGSAALV